MSRAEPKRVRSEEWLRAHRERMKKFRATKKRHGECRQCDEPAKIDPGTGEPMSACQLHLDEDKARVARAASRARKAKRHG